LVENLEKFTSKELFAQRNNPVGFYVFGSLLDNPTKIIRSSL
jgi:hypothetical protein